MTNNLIHSPVHLQSSSIFMQTVDSIIHAKWIVPIIPQHQVFTDCCIVIHNGKIVDIKPSNQIDQIYQCQNTIHLNNHVLMPGLINAHGHAAMSLFRGYADDFPMQTWLEEHIWPAEAKYVSADFVKDGTELAIAEMIRSGTTGFSDMYFFPDQAAMVAHHAGIRCQLTFPILELPSAWAQHADEYISKGLALRDNYRSHELINIVFGPHAPYTVSDNTFKRIATLAPEIQTHIQVHLHESKIEVDSALSDTQKRPIQRLFDLQVLTPATQCVHMTQLTNKDIELVAESGAHVIHCPESNLKLASGFCPVQKLLDAGINVALGTDGAASNNNLDMFGEIHTAALLAKPVSKNAAALNAQQALEMATINGAKALGIAEETGSLEIGKAADMIAIEVDPMEQLPLHNILSTLVYHHNGHRVTHNWVNGKPLLQDRQLLTLNSKEIINKAQQWQHTLQQKS